MVNLIDFIPQLREWMPKYFMYMVKMQQYIGMSFKSMKFMHRYPILLVIPGMADLKEVSILRGGTITFIEMNLK